MDQSEQINFGDLKNQERFKNLERSLRTGRLKHSENCKFPPVSLPNCSSINGDFSDSNFTLTTFQFTKTCSEVLTSCKNLKNLIKKNNNLPMATSSVKNYPGIEQSDNDGDIMPPPSSYNTIGLYSKRSAPADPGQIRIKSLRQSTLENRSQEKQTASELRSSHHDELGGPQDPKKENQIDRHFYRWKVFLNDQGQLLIKGSLNNETWARSKPIEKMLSSTTLESKYHRTYYLHGSIVDEKNELPKYIFSKFYNGFPDDWKNVREVWKTYIAQGSKESFRWPTDVSFSDDDANSEITEFNQVQKTAECKSQEISYKEKSTRPISSGYSSGLNQEKCIENSSKDEKLRNQSYLPVSNNSIGISGHFGENENRNQFNNSCNRPCSGNLYIALNYAHILKDIVFEDKLTKVTQNLLHEKCPKFYVKCVKMTIEYLNYIISYKVNDSDETMSKEPKIDLESEFSAQDLKRKCSTPLLETPCFSNEIIEKKLNAGVEKKEEEFEVSPTKKEMKSSKTDSDDSESEMYSGVPKFMSKNIMQSLNQKRQGKFDRNKRVKKERKNILQYDSCVSITEDETQKNVNNYNRLTSHLENVKTISTAPKSNDGSFNEEKSLDPQIENRAPLEMLELSNFEENQSPEKTDCFNKIPISSSNEKRKSMKNAENVEVNFKNKFLEPLQRKEMQNEQNIDSNSNRKRQKPRIINCETVNIKNFSENQTSLDKPNREQNRKNKEERSKESTGSKTTEVPKNPEEILLEDNQENQINHSFGSEKNPKLLETWIPLVTLDGKNYHLNFEGTLLNAVCRPMKKKFMTSHVVKRISSRVIETADHQFYKLVGNLNNSKHAVPKELASQCRNGCPGDINHFCKTWLKLKGENNVIVERSQKGTNDKSILVSSRGRNLIPPLAYWADERLLKKDGEVVYKASDPKEKYISPGTVSPSMFQIWEHVITNETVKGVLNSGEDRCLVKSKVAHKLKLISSEDEEDTKINDNLRSTHLYELKKRQKLEDIQTAETKKTLNSKLAAPGIDCIYKKVTGNADLTLSGDEMSIL